MANSNLVQSLLRCMDILDLVSAAESGLSMQDICKALNIKQPTAYNLVRTLMSRGYVVKTSPPVRYHLGGSITRLYEQQLQHDLTRRASDVMLKRFEDILHQLPSRTSLDQDASLSLAKPSGDELSMILRVRAYRPKIVEVLPDFHLGAYTTTSAMVYQAYCSPEERIAYRHHYPFENASTNFWKTEAQFTQELEATRQRGYALMVKSEEHQYRISVPVLNSRERLLGVLGLGVFGFALTPQAWEEIVRIMHETACEIAPD